MIIFAGVGTPLVEGATAEAIVEQQTVRPPLVSAMAHALNGTNFNPIDLLWVFRNQSTIFNCIYFRSWVPKSMPSRRSEGSTSADSVRLPFHLNLFVDQIHLSSFQQLRHLQTYPERDVFVPRAIAKSFGILDFFNLPELCFSVAGGFRATVTSLRIMKLNPPPE
jgi:hypothetical protein